MPLLNRRPFAAEKRPANLKPDDRVFYIPHTKEVFRDYDAYFNRTIHLNSMVWTCAATGRQGLTFEEALESERTAQVHLDAFPIYLERICLYLTSLTHRGKLEDVVSDVWLLMKARFFKGEEVELCGQHAGRVARVVAVHFDATAARPSSKLDVAENGDADSTADNSMTLLKSGRKNTESHIEVPAPQCYSYDVQLLSEDDECADDAHCPIISALTDKLLARRRSVFTKAKMELYIKQKTYVAQDHYAVKPSLVTSHHLDTCAWSDFSSGAEPKMPRTAMSKKAQTLMAHKTVEATAASSGDNADSSDVRSVDNAQLSRKPSTHSVTSPPLRGTSPAML